MKSHIHIQLAKSAVARSAHRRLVLRALAGFLLALLVAVPVTAQNNSAEGPPRVRKVVDLTHVLSENIPNFHMQISGRHWSSFWPLPTCQFDQEQWAKGYNRLQNLPVRNFKTNSLTY